MTTPPMAAQVLIALIPIIGISLGSVVAFFYLLWTHRERKLLIQRGAWTPVRVDLVTLCLLSGLLLVSVGLVLAILIFIVDGVGYGLFGGLIPFAAGLSLLVFVRLGRNPGHGAD
ncbi:MAG: hypothetical protein WCL50_01595 [Spirochaetota bacterium]